METTEKAYETERGTIRYWTGPVEAGRPWLVFLPGLTADHRLFDRQMEDLSGRFNCFVWDAPAHGRSRPFTLDFSLADMAEYLYGILAAEGISRPVLVGQSMGGYIAQVCMARRPGAAAGFVSIDSCPMERRYYTGAELWLLRHTERMYRAIPWKLLLQWGSRGTAETAYGRGVMQEMMESYSRDEFCALAAHGYRILSQAVAENRTYALTCPVLLLCGEKDAAGSCRRYDRNWARETGLPLVWVPGAGHNSNCDAPEFVNQAIEGFVRSLSIVENRNPSPVLK